MHYDLTAQRFWLAMIKVYLGYALIRLSNLQTLFAADTFLLQIAVEFMSCNNLQVSVVGHKQ